MSATIKYKGNTIASITTDSSKTLKTSGKYCEGDIVVENVQDGGITPSGNKALTPSETAQIGIDVTNFATVSVDAIPSTYVGSGVTRKAAATVAPSTSEQTVCASGVYTTGEQKVSAITPSIVGNLDASSFAASIVAAIEGKGVTVPDGTLLDGMASLIDSIEAGGGGANNVSFGTYTMTTETSGSHKVEHALGTTPAALLFVYVGLTTDISTKYDDALVANIIPNKNSVSYRWMFYRSRFQSANLSASATSNLWSTGTTNVNFDRVNNINDQYFCTPTNCVVGTYFWAVFKEALI